MYSHANHGAWSQSKIPWFSWGDFHAFHASMGQENCKNIPHESMGSMGYKTMGKHGKPMGIYRNESMESIGSMVFSNILLSIISRKY